MWNPWRSRSDDGGNFSVGYAPVAATDDDSDTTDPYPCFSQDTEDSSFDAEDTTAVRESGREEDGNDIVLRPGDHVYVWRSFGVPRAYQQHGIILSVGQNNVNDPDSVTVVTFYHSRDGENENDNVGREEEPSNDGFQDEGESTSGAGQNLDSKATVREESLRRFARNAQVHKVKYGSSVAKRLLSRAGTVTACKSDERGLVLARVRYLLKNPHRLPAHHMLSANGECAAVWCRIGRWCTLQGSSILHIMFVGQAGGAAAGGIVASNLFLWTPVPGYWGAIGFWWYVPATIAYPVIVPLLVTFGLMSLVPLEVLRRYRKKWKTVTFSLNHDFWLNASDDVKSEYFGSTESSDNEGMQKFFGMGKDEAERGKYMPLNSDGCDDGDESEDDEGMIERHRENMAAAYQMEVVEGRPSAHQSFLQQFDIMRQKWNQSWSNYCSKIKTPPSADTGEGAAVPLTSEGTKRRESLMPKRLTRRSWSSSSSSSQSRQMDNILWKWSKSWTSRGEKDRQWKESWTLREVKDRTTPSLHLLDEDEDMLL